MTIGFTPKGSRLLIRYIVEGQDRKTASGLLFMPDTAEAYDPKKNIPRQAVVVAVGPGHLLESGERFPMQSKVGDTVLVHPHAHTFAPIVIDGVLYHCIDEWNRDGGEVFGIVETA